MKKLSKTAPFAAALLFSGAALTTTAQAQNMVWGSYIADSEIEDPDFKLDGDGFNLGVKAMFNEYVFALAEYDTVEFDGQGGTLTFNTISIGGGAQTQINEQVSLYGGLSYEKVELEVVLNGLGRGTDDESGFGLRGGITASTASALWINGEIYSQQLDETDSLFFIGRFGADINPQFGVFGEYRTGSYEDSDSDGELDRTDVRIGVYGKFGG